MSKVSKTGQPPATGVSPELLELTLRYLRQRYGSREITEHVMWLLQYRLGDVEREYCKDETANMVRKERP